MPDRVNFAEEEAATLAFWERIDAFKTSVEKNKDKKPYTFYDGPPFATGLPHYGHILAGTIKVRWEERQGGERGGEKGREGEGETARRGDFLRGRLGSLAFPAAFPPRSPAFRH